MFRDHVLHPSRLPSIFFFKRVLKLPIHVHRDLGIMVRLKHRYLLVNILYPELEKIKASANIPDVVVFNQPTTSDLTPQALLRGLRTEISSLFGDYGSGAVSESLSGIISRCCFRTC